MRTIARSLAVEMALQERARGRRIATLRERAHLTQEAAADRLGVTLRAYQEWEAGGGIRFANLQKLAQVFKVPIERITGEESAPDPFKASGQLDRIEQRLADAETERDDMKGLIAQQNQLLARQSQLLAKIEKLVRVLEGVDVEISEPAAAFPGPDSELPAEVDEAHRRLTRDGQPKPKTPARKGSRGAPGQRSA